MSRVFAGWRLLRSLRLLAKTQGNGMFYKRPPVGFRASPSTQPTGWFDWVRAGKVLSRVFAGWRLLRSLRLLAKTRGNRMFYKRPPVGFRVSPSTQPTGWFDWVRAGKVLSRVFAGWRLLRSLRLLAKTRGNRMFYKRPPVGFRASPSTQPTGWFDWVRAGKVLSRVFAGWRLLRSLRLLAKT